MFTNCFYSVMHESNLWCFHDFLIPHSAHVLDTESKKKDQFHLKAAFA